MVFTGSGQASINDSGDGMHHQRQQGAAHVVMVSILLCDPDKMAKGTCNMSQCQVSLALSGCDMKMAYHVNQQVVLEILEIPAGLQVGALFAFFAQAVLKFLQLYLLPCI